MKRFLLHSPEKYLLRQLNQCFATIYSLAEKNQLAFDELCVAAVGINFSEKINPQVQKLFIYSESDYQNAMKHLLYGTNGKILYYHVISTKEYNHGYCNIKDYLRESTLELTQAETEELAWQFLYDLSDSMLEKCSIEDQEIIYKIGSIMASTGLRYEHRTEYGMRLQDIKKVEDLMHKTELEEGEEEAEDYII